MPVVHRRIDARWRRSPCTYFSSTRGGIGVALRRRAVVAGANVDVRGHVHEMTGAGHQRLEPLRRRRPRARACATLRRRGCNSDSRPDDRGLRFITLSSVATICLGARLRRAVERVELPRPQVHHALGVERGRIEIVRKPLRHLRPSRRSTPPRAPAACRRSACDVALRQRVDERALDVAAVGRALLRAASDACAPAARDRACAVSL